MVAGARSEFQMVVTVPRKLWGAARLVESQRVSEGVVDFRIWAMGPTQRVL